MRMDKAGREYWDRVWEGARLPRAINPRSDRVGNHANRKIDRYLRRAFSGMETPGKRLLELGAAQSTWLPYFSKEFGFRVSGIDYSEIGCQKARQILLNEGIAGEVICADFFSPPDSMLGAFDVVVSFGVVEHFEDTRAAIIGLMRFLKPKGLAFTMIPNMVGLAGMVEAVINRRVYDVHVPLDRAALKRAHEASGLEVIDCRYFLFSGFNILNLVGLTPKSRGWILRWTIATGLGYLTQLSWLVQSYIGGFPPNRWASPYILCLARRVE
jgi:2-polyprenyl-3-methyl-5-hydroxy-6-metoxy-1,4-benzoquinol methylase